MINEKELLLSNDNAIKKDFYQIYPQILEIASKLSNRYDPVSANESDPGVILLKLLAFIADKNNYNIDKNILECFMPSATQEDSMRKLCEMMGYNMGYYKSATTKVTFVYTKDLGEDSFTLKPFETTLTNYDGDINYILINEPVTIKEKNQKYVGTCIEGTLCDCTVGDSTTIKIANLDDNNRFYLPETQIAENGIWIRNYTESGSEAWDKWEKVNNLNNHLDNERIWKFGFDSNLKLPYIEFPDDINQLIENGLEIKYVRTMGANGNVSAHDLVKLSSATSIALDGKEETIDLIDENGGSILIINNESASSNGEDKETLNSAYNSFKKTVGTFETLVTCRDYANYIYNLIDKNDNTTPIVSNIQVSDIRDDIECSKTILTYSDYGVKYETSAINNKINPFNLRLYPFTPITTAETKENYIASFQIDTSNLDIIEADLKECKTLSHIINVPVAADVSFIKNYYKLKGRITTNYKVNNTEEKAILNNVYKALYKNFNLRQLDFGEPIIMDLVKSVIKGADSRIKDVDLDDPTITTNFLKGDNTEVKAGDASYNTIYKFLLAKNILAGRLDLFEYDNRYKYDLGQSDIDSYPKSTNKIGKIRTLFSLSASATNYTLKENEVIQFIAPNLNSDYTYAYGVLYNWKPATTSAFINANVDYKFVQGDYLTLNYTDSNGNVHHIIYSYNEYREYINDQGGFPKEWSGIIKSTFTIRPSYDMSVTETKTVTNATYTQYMSQKDSYYPLYSIGAKDTIETRDFIKDKLTKGMYCYWLIQNSHTSIPWELNSTTGKYEYILQENEYFFYSETLYELVFFGSGTKLITTKTSLFNNNSKEDIDLNKVDEEGLAAFPSSAWLYISFDDEDYLEIQEMQIKTLTEGDVLVSITKPSGAVWTELGNTFLAISSASYTMAGEPDTLVSSTIAPWSVRSRLDLNVGPTLTQALKPLQTIYAYYVGNIDYSDPDATFSGNSYDKVRTNYVMQRAGADLIDVTITKIDSLGNKTAVNDFAIMGFDYTEPTADGHTLPTSEDGYRVLELSEHYEMSTLISVPSEDNCALLMLYYKKVASEPDVVKVTTTSNVLRKYNSGDSFDDEVTLTEGINVIEIKNNTSATVKIKDDQEENSVGSIVISPLTMVSDVNAFGAITSANMLSEISTLDDDGIYYYNHLVDNTIAIDEPVIDEDTNSFNPMFWYDYNNVCNKFVISELDVASFTNLVLSKGSKL